MRMFFTVALLLFAAPVQAQNFFNPEQCKQSAQVLDTLIADREKTPYWKRDEFKEKDDNPCD